MIKKTIAQIKRECREKGLVYDVKTKLCRESKRRKKKSSPPPPKKKTIAQMKRECREKGLVYDVKTKLCRESKRRKKKSSPPPPTSPKSPPPPDSPPPPKKKTIAQMKRECREKGLVYDVKTKLCRESKRRKKKVPYATKPRIRPKKNKEIGLNELGQILKFEDGSRGVITGVTTLKHNKKCEIYTLLKDNKFYIYKAKPDAKNCLTTTALWNRDMSLTPKNLDDVDVLPKFEFLSEPCPSNTVKLYDGKKNVASYTMCWYNLGMCDIGSKVEAKFSNNKYYTATIAEISSNGEPSYTVDWDDKDTRNRYIDNKSIKCKLEVPDIKGYDKYFIPKTAKRFYLSENSKVLFRILNLNLLSGIGKDAKQEVNYFDLSSFGILPGVKYEAMLSSGFTVQNSWLTATVTKPDFLKNDGKPFIQYVRDIVFVKDVKYAEKNNSEELKNIDFVNLNAENVALFVLVPQDLPPPPTTKGQRCNYGECAAKDFICYADKNICVKKDSSIGRKIQNRKPCIKADCPKGQAVDATMKCSKVGTQQWFKDCPTPLEECDCKTGWRQSCSTCWYDSILSALLIPVPSRKLWYNFFVTKFPNLFNKFNICASSSAEDRLCLISEMSKSLCNTEFGDGAYTFGVIRSLFVSNRNAKSITLGASRGNGDININGAAQDFLSFSTKESVLVTLDWGISRNQQSNINIPEKIEFGKEKKAFELTSIISTCMVLSSQKDSIDDAGGHAIAYIKCKNKWVIFNNESYRGQFSPSSEMQTISVQRDNGNIKFPIYNSVTDKIDQPKTARQMKDIYGINNGKTKNYLNVSYTNPNVLYYADNNRLSQSGYIYSKIDD